MVIEAKKYDIDGHTLVLRSAELKDAEVLISYLKRICGETKYLAREADECLDMTIEQEEAFISKHNENDKACLILAELDGEYIGNASFEALGPSRRNVHRAELGIGIYKDYTGKGIGKKLFEELIKAAKKCGFEIAELQAVSDNKRALHMYESFGFKEVGRIPKANKYDDGTYSDTVLMSKSLI